MSGVMTPRPPHRRGLRGVVSDLAAALGGALVSLLLLWYLHGAWEPVWALLCGGLSGILFRRLVEPSYASSAPLRLSGGPAHDAAERSSAPRV